MTTAKTRRPATAAGAQRGTSAKKSGKASEPIPVLIRLPELRIEREPKADIEVTAAEAAPPVAFPLLAAPTDAVSPPALPAESPWPEAGAAVTEEPTSAAVPSLPWRRPSWSEFRVPQWALRGGIALGLTAVLVIAYFAIAGRSPKSDPAVSDDQMTFPADMPLAIIPAAGLPAPPGAQPKPSAPGGIANDKDAAGKPEKAKAAIEEPLDAARSSLSQAPQRPAEAATSPASPAGQPQTPISSQEATSQDPTKTAAAIGEQDAGRAEPAPGPADADTRSPLIAGTPAGDAGVAGDVYRYPVTDPATFQYPPDYHVRLQGQTRDGASPDAWAAPSGAGQYDRQPSTARLQPRIEPPPTR